jgi:hypothetical protein
MFSRGRSNSYRYLAAHLFVASLVIFQICGLNFLQCAAAAETAENTNVASNAINNDAIPEWGQKLATVASHIDALSHRSGELPAVISSYLSQLDGLLSQETYQKIVPESKGKPVDWDRQPLDTSKIELGIRIFGLLQIDGRLFIPNGASQGSVKERFPEIPEGSQAHQLASKLVEIETRYGQWLGHYKAGLGQGAARPLSPEARQKALSRLFPKYQIVFCSGGMCKHQLELNGTDGAGLLKIFNQEVHARGLRELVAVSPGGCNKACAMAPVAIYSTDELGNRKLEDKKYLGLSPDLMTGVREVLDSKPFQLDTRATPYDLSPSSPGEEKIEHNLCNIVQGGSAGK